jgi:hypothetical protein
MDETRRLAMRRAHTKRSWHCTCGKVVHGNGACASHKAAHVRKGEWMRDFTGAVVKADGHFYMTESERERRAKANDS